MEKMEKTRKQEIRELLTKCRAKNNKKNLIRKLGFLKDGKRIKQWITKKRNGLGPTPRGLYLHLPVIFNGVRVSYCESN